MSEKTPVIIPTYNHVELLKKCINSILRNTLPDTLDIVVVANGCKDGTEDYVKTLGNSARLISSPGPLGYTRAVNVGLAATGSPYAVLINDDVEILDWGNNSHWLNMMIEPMKADHRLAATGPSRDMWSQDKYFLVFSLVALKREALISLGGIDDIFNPGGGEDADFCLKAQKERWITRQVPREMSFWGTEYPFYHLGHATVCGVLDWDKTVSKNQAILDQRWPRTDKDKEASKAFSDGLQNFHRWAKEKKEC